MCGEGIISTLGIHPAAQASWHGPRQVRDVLATLHLRGMVGERGAASAASRRVHALAIAWARTQRNARLRLIDIRSEAGFTLFEALIAVALMGLILGAIATVTAQWLPNWNRGLARVQRNEQVAVALDRLVTDLAAAEHVFPNGKIRRPLFDGSEFAVTFVRSSLGPNSKPGLEIVRIAETTDALGRALVRVRAPFVPLPIGDPNLDVIPFADPVVLLRAPLRAVFSYSRGGLTWMNAWQNSTYLPSAVRFSVRNTATGRTLAVSTAATVHVNMAAPEPEQPDNAAPGADPGRSDQNQQPDGAGR